MTKWILAALLVSSPVYSQEGLFLASEKGRVTEKIYHDFMVHEYAHKIAVPDDVNLRKQSLNSPENAALAHFNAMLMGDYGLWLSLWDEKSKREIILENNANGQGAEFWQKWWRQGFLDYDDFRLTRRVDFGDYAIVEMTATSTVTPKKMTIDVPIKKLAPQVYAPTEDLRHHPVFQNWRKMRTDVLRK